MIPIAGSVWHHVLNGERGAVRVLGTVTDELESPPTVWVTFVYVHPNEYRSGGGMLTVERFHKAYRGGGAA